MENESKRIVFTFSPKDLENLEKIVRLGNYQTLAEAVRSSLKNMATIEEARHEDGAKVEVIKTKDGEKIQLQIG